MDSMIIGDIIESLPRYNMTTEYVPWDDPRVEYKDPQEQIYLDRITKHINDLQEKRFHEYGHCFTTTHVKTQGIVKGRLEVLPDLPEHLAQGLFKHGSSYPVAIRYSTETMARIDDRIEQPRGFSLKIFDVEGSKLRTDGQDPHTHDMEFNNAPAIELRDAKTTAEIFDLRTAHDDNPDKLNEALKKREDYELQDARNHLPNQHLVATRQYSQSAFRHGNYIAKYAVVPSSDLVKSLETLRVQESHGANVHADWLADFYASHEAVYELQAQLLTEEFLIKTECKAVEDSGIEWTAPFETIARVVVPAQDSRSNARRVFWEDRMRLDPWHGLSDHRPLGSTNRVRKAVYPASSAFRRRMVSPRALTC